MIEGINPQPIKKATEDLLSSKKEESDLKQACQEFEAMFLTQLLSSMRKTIPKSDIFGDRKKEEMWQDLMDSEVAKTWSQTDGIGLANILYQQMKKIL